MTAPRISGPREVAAPEVEPITAAECRDHLRVQPYDEASDGATHPDDALIAACLSAARASAEAFTGLAFAPREFEVALDEFPDDDAPLELPRSPVASILSITTDTGTSDETEFTDYVLDTYSLPARLLPGDAGWPATTGQLNGVVIRYLAGYGTTTDAFAALPPQARAAILLTLGALYDARGADAELPAAAQALLRPLRVNLGLA